MSNRALTKLARAPGLEPCAGRVRQSVTNKITNLPQEQRRATGYQQQGVDSSPPPLSLSLSFSCTFPSISSVLRVRAFSHKLSYEQEAKAFFIRGYTHKHIIRSTNTATAVLCFSCLVFAFTFFCLLPPCSTFFFRVF